MSLFNKMNGLLGNATEVSPEEIAEVSSMLLTQMEVVERSYKLVRDLFIFTNQRLIICDYQGVTGKRVSYLSIPYKSITHFNVQSAGHFDLNSELFIYISGSPEPIVKTFNNRTNVYEIQAMLATYVLNS